MKLHTINSGYFKLDGGAMFGVVPKSIWNRLNPADENNLCSWAMRLLLVDLGDRKVLIDSGIGDKQDDKFFSFYYLHGNDSLEKSLNKKGYSLNDITDNLLTHLHFDHCGGSIKWNDDRTDYEPTFPNATFHIGKEQWESAINPNQREKASFLKENILPMKEKGNLELISKDQENKEIFPGISVRFFYGHTTGLTVPMIKYQDKTIVYLADLMPSKFHIKPAYVMGYDIRPLETMQETQLMMKEAAENNYILFFEHDPETECCTVEQTDRGIKVKETFKLEDIG